MLNSKYQSYNSSPFGQAKQNICPNSKMQTLCNMLKLNNNKNSSPSLGTDSQFSVFNTINIKRKSINNSVATKSRIQIQAILQNFSTKSSSPLQNIQNCLVSHKSFLGLLGVMLGKDDISVEQAIQKCEEYEISGKQQLISVLHEKEVSHEWPLPISNLLLTELGELKIRKICDSLQNQEDLDEREMQLLQFLRPYPQKSQAINSTHLLECYNQFRNRIDQKCNIADELVKMFTLKIQPKMRQLKDKMLLIRTQKKLKRIEKQNNGRISFKQIQSWLQYFKLTEQEVVSVFKYLYWLQNEKVISLIDRKQTVKTETCYKQIFQKYKVQKMPIQTLSTIQIYEQQNNTVINELLNDKTYLLQTVEKKESEVQKLKNKLTILQLQLECKQRKYLEERARDIQNVKKKYEKIIKNLKEQCNSKDNVIRWYKNELEAVINENQIEWIAKNRQRLFYEQHIKNAEKTHLQQSLQNVQHKEQQDY